MSQDALGWLKHLKTTRARSPFPDDVGSLQREVTNKGWGMNA